MSLFTQPYAVPSRVKGAMQFLVQERGQRTRRDAAEALLSPASLKGEEGEEKLAMVRRTIDECVRLRLFLSDDDFVSVNPELPEVVRNRDTVAAALPGVTLQLILHPSDGPNQDLAAALAWFMAQDVFGAPGTWPEFGRTQEAQGAKELLNFNDTRYDNFRYWARFLGFANVIASPTLGGSTEERLIPDPTDALRRILGEILAHSSGRVPLPECLRNVAARCPLFEGGHVRETMDHYTPTRAARHLSSTTSLALLRLEEEGTIRLTMHSDADAVVLVDGSERRSVSEVGWTQRGVR